MKYKNVCKESWAKVENFFRKKFYSFGSHLIAIPHLPPPPQRKLSFAPDDFIYYFFGGRGWGKGGGGVVNIERNNSSWTSVRLFLRVHPRQFYSTKCHSCSSRQKYAWIFPNCLTFIITIFEVAKFDGLDPGPNPSDKFASCGAWGELGEIGVFATCMNNR